MNLREEMAQDYAAAILSFGQTFEWDGLTKIPCTRRDEPTMRDLQEGGWVEGVKSALVVSKLAFPKYSQGEFPRRTEGVDRNKYQIKNMKGDKDPAALVLVLYIGTWDA